MKRIADKHARSISEVTISWALQENIVVIPRASTVEHIASNAAMLPSARLSSHHQQERLPPVFLDADDMAGIRALDGSLGDLWG